LFSFLPPVINFYCFLPPPFLHPFFFPAQADGGNFPQPTGFGSLLPRPPPYWPIPCFSVLASAAYFLVFFCTCPLQVWDPVILLILPPLSWRPSHVSQSRVARTPVVFPDHVLFFLLWREASWCLAPPGRTSPKATRVPTFDVFLPFTRSYMNVPPQTDKTYYPVPSLHIPKRSGSLISRLPPLASLRSRIRKPPVPLFPFLVSPVVKLYILPPMVLVQHV